MISAALAFEGQVLDALTFDLAVHHMNITGEMNPWMRSLGQAEMVLTVKIIGILAVCLIAYSLERSPALRERRWLRQVRWLPGVMGLFGATLNLTGVL